MNKILEDLCPKHVKADEPITVNQSNYQAAVKATCYCNKERDAGDFEYLETIRKKHLKYSKSFFHAFRFSSTPYGLSFQ